MTLLPCGPARPTQVDLADLYLDLVPRRFVYRLRGMVCCTGGAAHQACVLAPERSEWLLYDDSSVTCVGSWADVQAMCQAQRARPSLLFYHRA